MLTPARRALRRHPGGAGAGLDLVTKAGGNVVEAAAVIDLGLGGREKLPEGLPLYVLVALELEE